jgi:lipoprotein-anchoring transpeptidase ErfK/SrfK
MKRGVLIVAAAFACLAAGVFSAAVLAATGPLAITGTTTTAPTTTAPEPAVIPLGVVIGKTDVGGLTPADATAVVKANFEAPLTIRVGHRSVLVAPGRLGVAARIRLAIEQARRAFPGTHVPLFVTFVPGRVSRYVKALARRFDRPARDAELVGLRGQRPWITKEEPGRALKQRSAVRRIVAALRRHERTPVRVRSSRVEPSATRAGFGPIVVIRRDSKRLHLYRGMRFWKVFGVATGQSSYPTPAGHFSIVQMSRHPWWYPPDSDWAKGEKPIPPGPGNPLGTRWMGLSAPGVGIHGTPDAASIGYSASHGCIRMRIAEAEWLFSHVSLGTPVFIVSA